LAIREKALGPDHPEVATSFGNLALLLAIQGQYAAAELFMRRSLVIREKALGPEHPAVADSLNKLGWLLMDQGQYAAADPYYRRSLAILKKSLGSGHPDVAHSMESLALLLAVQGQYAGAELHYRRSLAIREKALGPTHPDVVSSLTNLAGVLHEQKRYSDVIPILRRSRRIEAAWLIRELPLLSDQVRTDQLRQLGRGWEFIVQLIEFYPPATQLALETRLNRQGLLSEIEQRQALLLNNPNVDRVKVEQLQALTQQLASVTLMSDRRAEVRKQRDKLQAEIYRQIPELQPQLVTAGEVAKALPADGSLVEFQRYHPFVERKPKDKRWGAAQYIALVLKPDASVASVPLGPAAAIDATIQKGLQASADGLSDADAIWAQLSNQVLKPLLPQLSGSRQWFLSPDGELNRVPFAALPAPQQPGTPLGQAVQLRLLTTGRELVRLQQPTPAGSASLVMANPSYDRLGAKPGQESKAAEVTTVAQQRSAELGSNKWKQLPASEREGQTVAKLLSTGMLSGTSATTKALQRQHGPRVLHVATHGFFVADQETQPTEALRAIQEGSPLLSSLRRENPQLRSGLVLAGANQPELDPSDDGYLTAAEVVTLNLKGTELVVLSACSTGQGEVRSGEGVYGLQRSLTVAGARSTLLSLWKVDDAATAEFMDRYYQRLKAGEGRSDALAAVQLEFHSGKVQSPSGTNWKEPYYWAAWQLVGDWRPIKGL
jgi:CHAT domain-containing protein